MKIEINAILSSGMSSGVPRACRPQRPCNAILRTARRAPTVLEIVDAFASHEGILDTAKIDSGVGELMGE